VILPPLVFPDSIFCVASTKLIILSKGCNIAGKQADKADRLARLTRQIGLVCLFCGCYKHPCFVELDVLQTKLLTVI